MATTPSCCTPHTAESPTPTAAPPSGAPSCGSPPAASGVAPRFLQRLRNTDRSLLALLALLTGMAWAAPAQLGPSLHFMAASLAGLAPVLALSVALAAGIRASGAESLIGRAFTGRQGRAIALAALAGALSPLCSCGVVPLIAGLLAGGVPLAPVMAFWLASPVIDPAMFVLTAGAIDLEFAVVKTLAAIALGLLGGFATFALASLYPHLGRDVLRAERQPQCATGKRAPIPSVQWSFWRDATRRAQFGAQALSHLRLLVPLMAIAFLLESLMVAWLPANAFAQWLGGQQAWAVPAAVLLGIPAYLNGTAAVPLMGGMIGMGLDRPVALAFMVAGGVTSVPAAMAVWTLMKPRVFAQYLVLALLGSTLIAYAYAAWLGLGT